MSANTRKFISALLAVALVVVSVPFSSAVSSDYTGAVTGWWDKILYTWVKGASSIPLIGGIYGDYAQDVSGFFCKEVCADSPDAVHHASSVDDTEVHGSSDGNFTYATCIYCKQRFKVYASDIQQSYETQVQALPGNSFTSDGNMVWSPSLSDFTEIELSSMPM